MIQIRMLNDEEMKEAVLLSDNTFRDAEQVSMGKAFPYIFAEQMRHLSFGAFEDGRLISFMGLVPWTIRIGDASLRVFSLGSVCTHPDARGKGIASQILERVIAFTREAGASLLLVSGTRSLYTRARCMLFGRVRKYTLDENSASRMSRPGIDSSLQIRKMRASDVYALQELASSRLARYELGVNELATLIKAEAWASCLKMTHRVLVSERSGRVSGFAVVGVPSNPERHGLAIEHAGEAEAVAGLFGYAAERLGLKGLDIPVAWHEHELHSALEGVPYTEENQIGTIRIVDIDALLAQLRPWMTSINPALAERLTIQEKEDGRWIVGAGQAAVELTTQELVALLFDCFSAGQDKSAAADSLKPLFPVPFPNPGGLAFV